MSLPADERGPRQRREDRLHGPERRLARDRRGLALPLHRRRAAVAETPTRPSRARSPSGPNEAAEQFVPDAPPVDDSELLRPPPLEIEQAAAAAGRTRLPAPLLRRVKASRARPHADRALPLVRAGAGGADRAAQGAGSSRARRAQHDAPGAPRAAAAAQSAQALAPAAAASRRASRARRRGGGGRRRATRSRPGRRRGRAPAPARGAESARTVRRRGAARAGAGRWRRCVAPAIGPGEPRRGAVVPQPVLGVADSEMKLMGAAPRASRRGVGLPAPAARGRRRRRRRQPRSSSRRPAAARLARPASSSSCATPTRTGWQVVETPGRRAAAARTAASSPTSCSARDHPATAAACWSAATRTRRPADSTRSTVLRRDPGGRFQVLPRAAGRTSCLPASEAEPGRGAAPRSGSGRVAVAAFDATTAGTAAFFGARARASRTRSLHFDGAGTGRASRSSVPGGLERRASRSSRSPRPAATTPGCSRAPPGARPRRRAVRAHETGAEPALGRARPRRAAVRRALRRRRPGSTSVQPLADGAQPLTVDRGRRLDRRSPAATGGPARRPTSRSSSTGRGARHRLVVRRARPRRRAGLRAAARGAALGAGGRLPQLRLGGRRVRHARDHQPARPRRRRRDQPRHLPEPRRRSSFARKPGAGGNFRAERRLQLAGRGLARGAGAHHARPEPQPARRELAARAARAADVGRPRTRRAARAAIGSQALAVGARRRGRPLRARATAGCASSC